MALTAISKYSLAHGSGFWAQTKSALGSRLRAQIDTTPSPKPTTPSRSPTEPRAPSPERAGLTLVELLIAAMMMSILFVGLSSHLRGGIMVWRRITQTGDTLQRQRVAVDWLERDLTNAFLYKDERIDVPLPAREFTNSRLAFVTLQPSADQGPAKVRYVTYECTDHDGVKGLWRTSQSIGEARAKREAKPVLLLPHCEGFTVRYAYLAADQSAPKPLDWHDEWKPDPKDKIPRLLQISLQMTQQNAPQGVQDVATQRVQGTSMLPVGELMTFEDAQKPTGPPGQPQPGS